MASIELPVSHIKQAAGLCGAATAQMMLHFKHLAGNTQQVQDDIFEEIQDATGGVRPPDSQVKTHECPQWATQMCGKCTGEPKFTCWCSWPPAVAATLTRYGLNVTERSHQPADVMAAAEQILDAVDRGFPPAVLVSYGSHWVTVTGYVTGTGPQDATLIGARWVSEIHLNDPYEDAISSIAVDAWFAEDLTPNIICGPYINAVVVIGDAPPGPHSGGSPPPTTPDAPAEPAGTRRPPHHRQRRRRPPRTPDHPRQPGPRRRSRAKR